MPNWVKNHVTFNMDDKNEAQKLVNLLESNKSCFDFNNLVPRPKEYDSLNPSYDVLQSARDIVKYMNKTGRKKITQSLAKSFGVTTNEKYEELKIVLALYRKYGFLYWYDWSVHNWGTKWPASNAERVNVTDTRIDYYFDTAWNSPNGIIEALNDISLKGNMIWESSEEQMIPDDVIVINSDLNGNLAIVELEPDDQVTIMENLWGSY